MKLTRTVLTVLLLGTLAAGCGVDKSKLKKDGESSSTGTAPTTSGTPVDFLSLTAINPSSAGTGDTVSLTGTNFRAGARVEFGGVASPVVSIASPTRIDCQVPAGTVGSVVDVVVFSAGAQAQLNNAFTFTTPNGNGTGNVLARPGDYGNPTGMEQELLELMNRARRNPTAEGQRLGLDFSMYLARPALTFNAELSKAALGHTEDMVSAGFYGHTNLQGVGPNGRLLNTTYDLNTTYGSSTTVNLSENIGVGSGNRFKTPQDVHDTFMIDAGLASPKHRLLMLGSGGHYPRTREIGMGFRINQTSPGQPWEAFITQEMAFSKEDKPFITGVVFSDNGDELCRDGEGVKNATVTLTHASGFTISTITADAGGYSFEVLVPGDYELSVNGVKATVTVGTASVKVDWRDGQVVTY